MSNEALRFDRKKQLEFLEQIVAGTKPTQNSGLLKKETPLEHKNSTKAASDQPPSTKLSSSTVWKVAKWTLIGGLLMTTLAVAIYSINPNLQSTTLSSQEEGALASFSNRLSPIIESAQATLSWVSKSLSETVFNFFSSKATEPSSPLAPPQPKDFLSCKVSKQPTCSLSGKLLLHLAKKIKASAPTEIPEPFSLETKCFFQAFEFGAVALTAGALSKPTLFLLNKISSYLNPVDPDLRTKGSFFSQKQDSWVSWKEYYRENASRAIPYLKGKAYENEKSNLLQNYYLRRELSQIRKNAYTKSAEYQRALFTRWWHPPSEEYISAFEQYTKMITLCSNTVEIPNDYQRNFLENVNKPLPTKRESDLISDWENQKFPKEFQFNQRILDEYIQEYGKDSKIQNKKVLEAEANHEELYANK